MQSFINLLRPNHVYYPKRIAANLQMSFNLQLLFGITAFNYIAIHEHITVANYILSVICLEALQKRTTKNNF